MCISTDSRVVRHTMVQVNSGVLHRGEKGWPMAMLSENVRHKRAHVRWIHLYEVQEQYYPWPLAWSGCWSRGLSNCTVKIRALCCVYFIPPSNTEQKDQHMHGNSNTKWRIIVTFQRDTTGEQRMGVSPILGCFPLWLSDGCMEGSFITLWASLNI